MPIPEEVKTFKRRLANRILVVLSGCWAYRSILQKKNSMVLKNEKKQQLRFRGFLVKIISRIQGQLQFGCS